jgi:hypothetical protein
MSLGSLIITYVLLGISFWTLAILYEARASIKEKRKDEIRQIFGLFVPVVIVWPIMFCSILWEELLKPYWPTIKERYEVNALNLKNQQKELYTKSPQ